MPTDRSPGVIATLLLIGVYALAFHLDFEMAGEEIPFVARIVACCDAYNAMTTDRSYRKAMATAEAVAEIRRNSGTQFDPVVVDALIAAVEDAELLQAA